MMLKQRGAKQTNQKKCSRTESESLDLGTNVWAKCFLTVCISEFIFIRVNIFADLESSVSVSKGETHLTEEEMLEGVWLGEFFPGGLTDSL